MYSQNTSLSTMFHLRSIPNWGVAGAVMVGLPVSLLVGDEELSSDYMWLGFVSFLVIRSFLVWREYRDAKQGF